jgi:hypothetical protein
VVIAGKVSDARSLRPFHSVGSRVSGQILREWAVDQFLRSETVLLLARLVRLQAPTPIFAHLLIAVGVGFSKTVKISFRKLLFSDQRRDDLDKASPAKRRAVVIRSPGKRCCFFPLLSAPNTFDPQCVHDPSRKKLPLTASTRMAF